MAKKLYKIRDKVTGKFWAGHFRSFKFEDTGRSWKTREKLENDIAYFLKYRSTFTTDLLSSLKMDNWEIVEVEMREFETDSNNITDYLQFVQMRNEAEKINPSFGRFMDAMRAKGVLDKIEFIFKLKSDNTKTRAQRIIEARAAMRQLGVKTRTFRESGDMFGLMDRQQALKARMVLDIQDVVDLGTMRSTQI